MTNRRTRDDSKPRVAYIMSRFPKLTETFILFEMLAMRRQGADIGIYPLRRERTKLIHPDAASLCESARFLSAISPTVLFANLYWLARSPFRYLSALARGLSSTWGSARYFFGALLVFPIAAAMARRMQQDRIEHIHAHFASHPAFAAFVISRLTGIPFSFTAHGSDLHREKRMLKEKIDECRFAVAISDFNREWMIDIAGEPTRDKIHVVHCGVHPSDFDADNPAVCQDDHRQSDGLILLCIGTLHEVKGQRFLIEAVSELVARGIDCKAQFVGSGHNLESLQRLSRQLKVEDRVEFCGALSRPDVIERLHRADVIVTPSVASADGRREGIPVVLMEAMASGKPVIASRLSGIPELVEHDSTGLLTPPGDARCIADAVERLAREPETRSRLARRGRQRIEREFNLSIESRKLLALIRGDSEPTHNQRHSSLQSAEVS